MSALMPLVSCRGIQACKAEMRDLKQHLHQKSRTLEEYQAKETAFAQVGT